ncbi:winged helix-turn-helix domain-containing protein [Agathobaculum sp.]|uniref:winged helix-turn-helix domain-containing protein n=1 Tax=Agathobaculum sp. TaxID=2048138 RepID=UPI003FA4A2DF
MKNSNRVLTFEQIYNAVWHEEYLKDNSTIFYHVGNLRKKINVDWIESVYGTGYRIHDLN